MADEISEMINALDEIGLKPVVITAATDEELFRKRLAEAAAALPSTPAQRVVGTQIITPAARSAVVPGDGYITCSRCSGSGRFITRHGRDFGECFACKGSGTVVGRPPGTSSYIKPSTAAFIPIETKQYPNILAAFDEVQRRGLKKAAITIGDINISLAGRASRNPGALYVKHLNEYAGKIEHGKSLILSFKCHSPQTMLRLLDAIEVDPRAAITAQAKTDADRVAEAVAAGLEPVVPCCCCGILLTDPESRQRGIGPICGGRWGLAGFKLMAEALSLDDL